MVKCTHGRIITSALSSGVPPPWNAGQNDDPQLEHRPPVLPQVWWRGQCFFCDHWYLIGKDRSFKRTKDEVLITAHHEWHLKWYHHEEPRTGSDFSTGNEIIDRHKHRELDSLMEAHHHTDHSLNSRSLGGPTINSTRRSANTGERNPLIGSSSVTKVDEGGKKESPEKGLRERVKVENYARSDGHRESNVLTGTSTPQALRSRKDDLRQPRLSPQVMLRRGKSETATNEKTLVKRTGHDTGKQTHPKSRFRS